MRRNDCAVSFSTNNCCHTAIFLTSGAEPLLLTSAECVLLSNRRALMLPQAVAETRQRKCNQTKLKSHDLNAVCSIALCDLHVLQLFFCGAFAFLKESGTSINPFRTALPLWGQIAWKYH